MNEMVSRLFDDLRKKIKNGFTINNEPDIQALGHMLVKNDGLVNSNSYLEYRVINGQNQYMCLKNKQKISNDVLGTRFSNNYTFTFEWNKSGRKTVFFDQLLVKKTTKDDNNAVDLKDIEVAIEYKVEGPDTRGYNCMNDLQKLQFLKKENTDILPIWVLYRKKTAPIFSVDYLKSLKHICEQFNIFFVCNDEEISDF